jgi:pyrimidine oxygenase
MMGIATPESSMDQGFALPSDHGGKDFGIFMPMANGGWILSSNAPPLDGSYAYNHKVALLADEFGFDFIMSMAKWRGYGGVTQHWRYALDSQVLMAALAAVTKRVRVVATVHTLLQNPAVTAKMVATLDQISGGRAGLNVVTGSYKGEFEQMSAWRDDVNHDQRYDLAEEWIEIIKRLWIQESVDFDGKYFTMIDCQSDPKPAHRPFLLCAGTSHKGMQFTVDEMDAIFAGGKDDRELAKICGEIKTMARAQQRMLKTYTMMTLVIADTDAEAQAQAEHYRAGFDAEACKGMMRAYGFLDAEIGKENSFVQNARSSFMSAHIIGSVATVTSRLIEMLEHCHLDGMMLIFPDYLKSIPIFARDILPQIRERFPERVALAHAG